MNIEAQEFREVSLAEAMTELGLQTADALKRSMIFDGGAGLPREKMAELASEMAAVVRANALPMRPTVAEHLFADGQVARKYMMPAGQLAVTRTHKKRHFILALGDCTIWTNEAQKRLVGFHFFVTHPGTQRVIVAHADTLFITTHVTDLTDPDAIVAALTEEQGDPK